VEFLLDKPPQESSAITPSAKQTAKRTIRSFFLLQRFRPVPRIPATTTQPNANSGNLWGKSRFPRRSSAEDASLAFPRTVLDCVPKFGPALEMERLTVLAADPAVIDAGLKVQLVKTGRLLQAKFTAEVKFTPTAGAAENVYVALCPASTVTLELPVSVQFMFAPDPVTVSVSVGVAW
jgi:hypothetical protein